MNWRREVRAAHLALTFLTTLPLPHTKEVREGDFARAAAYYPLAGYAVGGLVALLLWLPLPAMAVGVLVTGWLFTRFAQRS